MTTPRLTPAQKNKMLAVQHATAAAGSLKTSNRSNGKQVNVIKAKRTISKKKPPVLQQAAAASPVRQKLSKLEKQKRMPKVCAWGMADLERLQEDAAMIRRARNEPSPGSKESPFILDNDSDDDENKEEHQEEEEEDEEETVVTTTTAGATSPTVLATTTTTTTTIAALLEENAGSDAGDALMTSSTTTTTTTASSLFDSEAGDEITHIATSLKKGDEIEFKSSVSSVKWYV